MRYPEFLWKMPPEIHALVENADNLNAATRDAVEEKVRPGAVFMVTGPHLGHGFPLGRCIAVVAWIARPLWGARRKFGEPLQILCDCCQRELELRAARSSQAQSSEPQNALEVREQHLDLFTIAA